jgi:hypothetical protein
MFFERFGQRGAYRLEVTAAHSPGTDSVVRTADFEVEQ